MRFCKHSILFVVIFLCFSLFLAACAGDPEANNNNDANNANNAEEAENTEDTEETEGEGGTGGDLVIANTSDAVSLDPAGSNDVPSSDVQENIYESLTHQDMDMEVQPSLATDWVAIDDLTWEFTLR